MQDIWNEELEYPLQYYKITDLGFQKHHMYDAYIIQQVD